MQPVNTEDNDRTHQHIEHAPWEMEEHTLWLEYLLAGNSYTKIKGAASRPKREDLLA